MKALVLAAGEGKRLRPLTDAVPKPLIAVGGKPILQHNIELLVRYGFDKIFINLHYRASAIMAALGDGSSFGASITYSYEEKLMGTAGAAERLASSLDGSFLLVYGDNLSTIDLGALRRLHESSGASATLAVFEREDVTESGIVGIDATGRVTDFLEKPGARRAFSHWVNAGYIFFSKRVFDYIPHGVPSDFGRDVLPAMLRAGECIYAYKMREGLWWIDSPADYERTCREYRAGA